MQEGSTTAVLPQPSSSLLTHSQAAATLELQRFGAEKSLNTLKKESTEKYFKNYFTLLHDRRKIKIRKTHSSRDSPLAFNSKKQWDLTP